MNTSIFSMYFHFKEMNDTIKKTMHTSIFSMYFHFKEMNDTITKILSESTMIKWNGLKTPLFNIFKKYFYEIWKIARTNVSLCREN